jgi:hypothetical protein
MDRRIFILALGASLAIANTGAFAQKASSWDGTWVGAWGSGAQTSIQILHGRVVRYEYRGSPVPIATQKVSAQSVTFGIPGDYTVSVDLTGPGKATASYNSTTRGSAAADLTKQ